VNRNMPPSSPAGSVALQPPALTDKVIECRCESAAASIDMRACVPRIGLRIYGSRHRTRMSGPRFGGWEVQDEFSEGEDCIFEA
jgi:hypothetical protein